MSSVPISIRPNPAIELQAKKELTLCISQAPGDVLVTTAAARDLKKKYPYLKINVQTRHVDIWKHNPHVTILDQHVKAPNPVMFSYKPDIQRADVMPTHFIGAMYRILETTFKIPVPITAFRPEVFLSDEEKQDKPFEEPYWILVCGGKSDFTTKWWNPEHAAKVVEHFKGKFKFVQLGKTSAPGSGDNPSHTQFPIPGAIDLINKTSLRDVIKLVYHSEGVLCPVTFMMHLAAAVPPRVPGERNKPCVVVAGGREPVHWEAYPGHQFLHTIGQLDCCATKCCWARRAQLIPDNMPWNTTQLCSRPVQVNQDLRVAQCMEMITADKVINAIESYFQYYTIGVNK